MPEANLETSQLDPAESIRMGADKTNTCPVAELDLRIRFYKGNGEGLNRVSFSVSKREIEIQTGSFFTIGDTYRLKGRIGNLWNFEVDRTITRDRYFDIYVPTKFQERFKRDENYRIAIDSVRLVNKSDKSATTGLNQNEPFIQLAGPDSQRQHMTSWSRNTESPVVPHLLKAQASKVGKAISFALSKSWIENKTKINFEPGRVYRIRGSLGNVCGFDTLLRETGYSEVHSVFVPSDHAAKFEPGEKCDVRIDEIKEVAGAMDNQDRKIDGFWDWKTVAAWADTEGQYQSGHSGNKAVVSQDEREPLDGICDFLLTESIPSIVYDMGNGHYQLRTLGGMETLAKFILNTESYIRTQNKRNEIAKFKDLISTRSQHESVRKRNARRILGL